MRGRIIQLAFMVFTAQVAMSQGLPGLVLQVPLTRLEKMVTRQSTLISVESYYIETIFGENGCAIHVQALIANEEGVEAPKARGIKIEIDPNRADKNARSTTSYVDFEELNALIKALTSMRELSRKGTALPNAIQKDLSFSTIGGLTITMSQRETERQLLLAQPLRTTDVCIVKRDSEIGQLKASIEKAVQSFLQ